MSKPSSKRGFRKQNQTVLGLTGALGDDGGDSDTDLMGNPEDTSNRAQRFATSLEGNHFRELEQYRLQERKQAIAQGLIADPDRPTSLENAIEFVGTCTEMCPLFEREEREFKKNVHPLEQKEGQPGRIDPAKAVTMYHRSAAGIDQPLPSDVRTPTTLKRTLDYLFHKVLETQPADLSETPTPLTALRYTHGFIRDRTRGIRQDFTYQRHVGIMENIECHERIARFHILAIHEMGRLEDGQFLKQEAEQLNKTLISLIELYDDQRLDGKTCRNEPEFRAYQLLSHLNDNEVARTILDLPHDIFSHPHLQLAFTFRALAQRNFDTQKVGSKYNADISLNFFSRFFKRAKRPDVPFLIACLAHNKFGDIRRAGIRALRRAYPPPPQGVVLRNGEDQASLRAMPMGVFVKLMDCQDEKEAMAIADALAVEPYYPRGIDGLDPNVPLGFLIHKSADFDDNGDAPPAEPSPEIEAKRAGFSYQDIIDGKLANAITLPTPGRAKLEPRGRVHSGLTPNRTTTTAPAFSPKPSLAPPPATSLSATPAVTLNASANSFLPSGFRTQEQLSAHQSPPAELPVISTRQAPGISQVGPSKAISSAETTPRIPFTLSETPRNTGTSASPFTFQKNPTSLLSPVVLPVSAAKQPMISPTASIPSRPAAANSQESAQDAAKLTNAARSMSSQRVEGLAKKMATKALVSHTMQYVQKTTQRVIDTEQLRRLETQNRFKLERRTQLENRLCERMLDELVEGVVREEVADAYGEEMWEHPLRQKAFAWWKTRALMKRARRHRDKQRSLTRGDFSRQVKALTISALGTANGDEDASESGRPGLWSMDDVDHDIASSLRKLTKRKAILDEGTFFSVLSSYICNLSNKDENEPHDTEAAHKHVEWNVILSVTDQSSGVWLKSKFNLKKRERYSAEYHGEYRNAKVTALADPEAIPETTGLIVFECSSEPQRDQERMSQLIQKIPCRPLYQIGLLLLQWQDRDEAWLSSMLGLDRDTQPFTFVASVNMAQDASDQTFLSSLQDALPRISHVPLMEVSMEAAATSLFGDMGELLSFVDYLLLQNIEDAQNIAQIITYTLDTLEKLQHHVLEGIVEGLQISSEEYSTITFGCAEHELIESTDDLLDWLASLLREAAKNSPYVVVASEYFSQARQRGEDSLSFLLSRFLDMVGRSVLESTSHIHVDITENELERMQELTHHECEQFQSECTVTRNKLATFAKVEYDRNPARPTIVISEEAMQKAELELASERLKALLRQSTRETSDSQLSVSSSHQGRKRPYADAETSPSSRTASGSQDKRLKAVSTSNGPNVDGLCKLRAALAQARTVLQAS